MCCAVRMWLVGDFKKVIEKGSKKVCGARNKKVIEITFATCHTEKIKSDSNHFMGLAQRTKK